MDWCRKIDWAICGGESGGPPERRLVQKCSESWIYATPCGTERWGNCPNCNESGWEPKPEALAWVRSLRDQCQAAGVSFFLKQWGGPSPKSGGRLLDGQTWDQYPEPRAAVPA
ncbi:MAG: DUF5131 family protein [Patescibacteria group bacterium]|nr:DUF5131 family protein [Patescibacteria group bacterium]